MRPVELLEPTALLRADWDVVFSHLARDMDPWAVDLVELLRRFRDFLGQLASLELEVPGRMLHAGAVLLRMKSDWLRGQERTPPTLEEVVEEVAEEVPWEGPAAEEVYIAPELRLPIIRRPRARISVADLRRALQAALAHGARKARPTPALEPEDVGLDLAGEPFTRRALRLWKKLLSLVNGQRVIPFHRLAEPADPSQQVATFMELLHLDAQGKVRLFQKEFLGELLIEVPRGAESAG
jgi:chromatin segregation and condensation protein Rec8/ScpA/Scc1 (kleisin family)